MSTSIPSSAARGTTAPKQTAAPAVDGQRKNAQATMASIEKKAKEGGTLTAEDRQTYADNVAVDKVLESATFLGMLGGGAKDKLIEKLEKDIDGFLKSNPNATPEQIKEHVTARFKAQLSTIVVGKSVVDMAMKQMSELTEKIRDGWDKK